MAILKRQTKRGTRYQVMIDRRDPITGKRNRTTVGTYDTEKEAKRNERKALTSHEEGQYIKRTQQTVGEVLTLWLESKEGTVRNNTFYLYRNAVVVHWFPVCRDLPIQKLTPQMIQRTINDWRKQGKGRSLIRTCFKVMSSSCRFAVAMQIIPASPCEGVQLPRMESEKQVTVWSEDELARFMQLANDDTYALLWNLLIETGMRRAEALGLTWEAVDWETATIRIEQTAIADSFQNGKITVQQVTKTDAGRRSLAISPYLMDLLREEREESGFIFHSRMGTPIQPGIVSHRLRILCEVAGVPVVTIHNLRHLAATRMARAMIPEVVAQKRLGHASSEITRRVYQHVDVHMQADAVKRLALPVALPQGTEAGGGDGTGWNLNRDNGGGNGEGRDDAD